MELLELAAVAAGAACAWGRLVGVRPLLAVFEPPGRLDPLPFKLVLAEEDCDGSLAVDAFRLWLALDKIEDR